MLGEGSAKPDAARRSQAELAGERKGLVDCVRAEVLGIVDVIGRGHPAGGDPIGLVA